jgi:hypothetical protein
MPRCFEIWICLLIVVAVAPANQARSKALSEPVVVALEQLRQDINREYGLRNDVPRVNLGPCGRFAKEFREQWNAKFRDPARIAFVISKDGKECHHVLVQLPDGRFYDGGNGIMTKEHLVGLWAGSHVRVMKRYDFVTLNRMSYGLGRSYPVCPNYSDVVTTGLIRKHLGQLRGDNRTREEVPGRVTSTQF